VLLMYLFVILMLSDAMMLACMHCTRDDRRNLMGPKVVSISLAAAQFDAQLDICHNPFYSQLKMVDKNSFDKRYLLMKFS
jgi:hypothetical protein